MIFLLLVPILALLVFLFLQQPQFGKLPGKKRLQRIQQSPHYKNGSFQNRSHTPSLAEGVSYYAVMKEFFLEKKERMMPVKTLPSIKTELRTLDPREDVLVWFGHSSYFLQTDGKRILVDPVFSGSISPLPIGSKAFKGADIYTTDDIPEIDYLFISHDHWDHLDYTTIKKLQPKIKAVICGLGVGEHLEHWGYNPDVIMEKDWNETFALDTGFTVSTVPARHFSGRGLSRNKSLWLSFVLQTPTKKIFLGGDSGYDTHFADIGKTYGPFDMVILENGQYDAKWRYIHLLPDEIVQAATDLQAKKLLPVHWAKFVLANHAWDEPMVKLMHNKAATNIPVLTPMIGEKIELNQQNQAFSQWWEKIG